MSQHAAIDLNFGDGAYRFRLGLGELEELERKLGMSIFQIATRLSGDVRRSTSGEIVEVLRIGLIGGGTAPMDALALVRRYVDERPLEENRDTAYAVALAALTRLHPDETEKRAAGEVSAAETSASTSPPSTAQLS